MKTTSIKASVGLLLGALLGIPGSYFFQSGIVQQKCGGFGGYLQHLPDVIEAIGSSEDRLGVGANFVLGVIVFAVVGLLAGALIGVLSSRK